MNVQEKINTYVEIILKKKHESNIISKSISKEELDLLIIDGQQIEKIIKNENVIDVGSGNGILGIPLAIKKSKSTIHLVEPRIKKVLFLNNTIEKLKLKNIDVFHQDIETYLKESKYNCTAIARGFPSLDLLYSLLQKRKVNQLIIISSSKKIYELIERKKIQCYKIYDIKNREVLKILSMESVSRETL